jgi:hypothetical protein
MPTIKKILVRVLATVGAISILCVCGYVIFPRVAFGPPGSFTSDTMSHSFPSPDGKYKAVLIMDAGGGAGSGYCNARILIIPASYDEQKAALERNRYIPSEGRYEIFSGICEDFHDHTGSPKLKWLSDDSLEVDLSINSTALFADDLRLRKSDDSKKVNVKYVIEYDPVPAQ